MTKIFKTLNIKLGILLAVCSVALLATGCITETQDPEVSASVEEIMIGSEAANVPVAIRSNTDWVAATDANWFFLSQDKGLGTTDISVMVEANISGQKRTADINVTTGSGEKTVIRLTQYGLSHTEFRVMPKNIVVGAKASTGHSFVASAQFKDAEIDAEITSGGEWIKNLTAAENIDGYTKSMRYLFDVLENTDSDERTGTILVTVTFGRNTYTEEVTVIQNGLGAPAISTASNAYMMYNQTLHTQNLWMEDGDQTNVRYECHVSSAQSGTGNTSTPWITGASVDGNGVLHITALTNDYDEVREGDVLVVAFRNSASTKTNIHVIQTGYLTPGLNLPTSILVHNSEAETYTAPLNPINNSKVEVVDNNSAGGWVYDVKVNNDNMLVYSLKAYDGAEGQNREATITLKVTNGHANAVHYYITIRQYAPEAAGISLPTTVISHTSGILRGTLPINPLNGSTVEVVAISESWIKSATIVGNSALRYNLDKYNGEDGEFREGIITLKATNSHANSAYYYVTIRQYTPMEAGISITNTPIIHNHYAETDCMVILNPLYKSNISLVDVSKTWVHDVEIVDNVLYYDIDMYDGAEGPYRDAVITLKATNAHVNAAYYYIVIRQYAPSAPGINTAAQHVTHSFEEMTYTLPVNPINHSEIEVEDVSVAWITNCAFDAPTKTLTYKLDKYQGGEEGGFREGVITLKASNDYFDDTYYYITVYQVAPEQAAISMPVSLIAIDYREILNTDPGILPINVLNNSTVVVENISEGWVTSAVIDNTTKQLQYAVEAYDGAQGEFREAVITLKATNEHIDAAYYYVTIRQYTPGNASISMPVNVIYHSADAVSAVLALNLHNASQVEVEHVSDPVMVTAASININNDLEYTLSAYDGANGPSRSAVITLKATNDHADATHYYITIVQYSPDRAAVCDPVTLITHGHELYNGTLTLNLRNGSTINSVTSSQPAWLTAGFTGNVLEYSLTAYDGSQGPSREGVITVAVANAHADMSYYYITVRQYAPDLPTISLPVSTLSYDYRAQSGALPLNVINYDAATTTVNISVPAGSWITGTGVDSGNNTMFFSMPAYDGALGNFRSEVITIEVSNSHANKAYYYVTVKQYAPNAAGISDLPEYIGLGYQAQTGLTLPFSIQNGSTVKVVSFPNWLTGLTVGGTVTSPLTYNVQSYTGSTAINYVREGVIVLSATNANANVAYYYVTVRQYGRNMAYLNTTSLSWSWITICAGSNMWGGKDTFVPGQYGQSASVNNVPGPATITIQDNTGGNFSLTSSINSTLLTITPTYWGPNTIDPWSASGVVYVVVNAAPYVQTLTLNVSLIQSVRHDH